MAYPNDNLHARVYNILSLPHIERCQDLAVLVEHCSVRELQEIFPTIVYSVFEGDTGGIGWGLRTITEENAPHLFATLYQFFAINGAMIRLIHRLLADTIKFEFNADLLPHKLVAMLQSGQHSIFYTDLINVDPYRRRVVSLTLNSFEFYILHFALHALKPLHRINPLAQRIHNDRIKSIYYILVSDYLSNYMPGHPDVEVMPPIMCYTLKTPQPIQMQTFQPKPVLRYLRIQSSYDSNATVHSTNVPAVQTGGPRAYAWRTESVLHFFIDVWLRFDVEGEHDLPGSEFVRIVRVLFKQTHFFANAALLDNTAMAPLRKIAQPLLKALAFPFLRSLIDRWPLDSSMAVVLELWLSYIQPWRYTINYTERFRGVPYEPIITNYFNCFIADNLLMYTQIFYRLLPRFEHLDYSVFRNAVMLHRLAKILSQPGLCAKIEDIEREHELSFRGDTSPGQSRYIRHNTSSGSGSNYNSFYNETIPKMFSDATRKDIENFLYTVNVSRVTILRDIREIEKKLEKKKVNRGILKCIFDVIFDGKSTEQMHLEDIRRIPEMLRQAIGAFSCIFKVDVTDVSIDDLSTSDQSSAQQNFSFFDSSDYLDISKITPHQIRRNYSNINTKVDPALLPIQSNEIPFLVRLLHHVSSMINERFGSQIQVAYSRNDFIGKLLRQVLNAPINVQWFDKSGGHSVLFEDKVPAKVSLRPLASLPVILMLFTSLIVGYLIWNAPFFGLFVLGLIYSCYICTLAIIK